MIVLEASGRDGARFGLADDGTRLIREVGLRGAAGRL